MTPANGDEPEQPNPRPHDDSRTGQRARGATRAAGAHGDGRAGHGGGTVFERDDAGVVAGESYEQVGASTGEFPAEQTVARHEREAASTGKYAALVGAGILLSRIVGLVRQRVFAYYFGTSAAKGAFDAAFKIPNFLQNVFGEGALSASFIPVYASLLARDERREAGYVAGAVLSLLALVTSLLVLLGILSTPYLITVIAPGFTGETRELTIRLVKIFFPGAGLLVISAWCLGVLNSHKRFFLSYTAPVIWNLSIIGALVGFGGRADLPALAVYAAWGSVVGSFLQFAVQLPTVLRLVEGLRPALDLASTHVRAVVRNFVPVFFSRGVVQISAYIDAMLASFISAEAVGTLTYAQSIYTLPISLFGMSVSAVELAQMSGAVGDEGEVAAELQKRLDAGLRRIAFLIVPSAVAFLALGDVIVGVLYQTGRFHREDTIFVWGILAGSTVGLLASTLGRLYSSTYYALRDTRTPLRFAVVRVVLTTVLGYLFALPLPRALGIDPRWGVAGLTSSAGLAGWVEFYLLRRSLNRRIGRTGLAASFVARLWVAALAGAGLAWAIKLSIGKPHPFFTALLVLVPYGLVYFAAAALLKVPESGTIVNRFLRPLRRLRG
ncbi:MAG TPA: murein biosynthesis integral membrane protein MurJ [Pyrinomonadaceae bacterium]|jgi:putative peptidoglycan lipid II flippase|nr:murein biosynthesis integral membrane protein MurJ [Pyrinomonadaceae bacterium]